MSRRLRGRFVLTLWERTCMSRNRTGENRTDESRPLEWTISWALPWTPSWDVSWGVLEGLKTEKMNPHGCSRGCSRGHTRGSTRGLEVRLRLLCALPMWSHEKCLDHNRISKGCNLSACKWRFPAYSGAVLLTIVFKSFPTYNWIFLLGIGVFCL